MKRAFLAKVAIAVALFTAASVRSPRSQDAQVTLRSSLTVAGLTNMF